MTPTKAERLIGNLARRLEREAPGVAASILEGLDEILTVTRLGLPMELSRSLACTNIIENPHPSAGSRSGTPCRYMRLDCGRAADTLRLVGS